ncbi:MAG: hypothetical protein LBR08_08210 [Bacteroidales bacterium]|jgi:hypothetical protein|nr:hypothetical protein [Bacteroidales bacterium]
MKVLLDECITKRLKHQLSGFNVYTVNEMGWSGVKNGKLMMLCVDNRFDVLLTIDKNIMYRQNLEKYPITVVVLDSVTSKLEEPASFIPYFMEQVPNFEKN